MRHVGRSTRIFLLCCAAGLAGCGGGVPGVAGPEEPSLPEPPKGVVAPTEALQFFTLAGDGRSGPFVAWLDRAGEGPAIEMSRYDKRREAPWGSPDTYPGEISLPRAGVRLSVLPLAGDDGSLLLFRVDQRVLALHPGRNWRKTLDDGTEFKHFAAASGPMGLWAVAQVQGDVPRLWEYRPDQDDPWEPRAPLLVDDLGPRSPALAVGEDSVTVAYLDFSREAIAQTDLRIDRWDGGDWSRVAMFDDVGGVTPIVCPGGRVVAWTAAIGGGGHRVETAVDSGDDWARHPLHEGEGLVKDLQCVVDIFGGALLAWMAIGQADGEASAYRLWAARFDGAEWQVPERLAEPDATEATQAQSFDLAGQPRDGQAVVVYHMAGDRGGGIWARRFDRFAGWGPPRQVSGCCAPAQVAMDGSGTAAVLWGGKEGPLWWARLDAREAAP